MFFLNLIFCFLPLYVWWIKRFPFLKGIVALSFFLLAFSFILPESPWFGLGLSIGFLFIKGKPSLHPHRSERFMNKWIRYPLEGILIYGFYGLFKILPASFASWLGSKLGRFVGNRLPKRHRLGMVNLKHTGFENKKENLKILAKMWENFGRTVAEVPHLKKLAKQTPIEGMDHLKKLKNKPFMIVNAHFNSLGLCSSAFKKSNQTTASFFRPPNNPLVVPLIENAFGKQLGNAYYLPKGKEGMFEAMKLLKQNVAISITPDIDIAGGDSLLFLGKPARTSTALVRMAAKFHYPIIPVQVIREKGIQHRVVVHPPIYIQNTDDQTILSAMQMINDLIGDWVKEHPEQWFWINNRWNLKL